MPLFVEVQALYLTLHVSLRFEGAHTKATLPRGGQASCAWPGCLSLLIIFYSFFFFFLVLDVLLLKPRPFPPYADSRLSIPQPLQPAIAAAIQSAIQHNHWPQQGCTVTSPLTNSPPPSTRCISLSLFIHSPMCQREREEVGEGFGMEWECCALSVGSIRGGDTHTTALMFFGHILTSFKPL